MTDFPSQPVKDDETSFSLFNWLRKIWIWLRSLSDAVIIDDSVTPPNVTLNNDLYVNGDSYLQGDSTFSQNIISTSGNIECSGSGQRFLADFSTSTIGNRLSFKSNVTNGNTGVVILPNGTSNTSAILVVNKEDPTNSNFGRLQVNASEVRIESSLFGTGSTGSTTYFPLNIYTSATLRFSIDASGNVIVGTAALTTSATAGFLWIPSCAGAPSGSPTSPYTDAAALVVDITNSRLYVRVGSTWKYAALT